MADKVRIGIIGCGTIGTVHAKSYQKVANSEIVAMCDLLEDRLQEKAKEFGVAKTYTDYRELVKDPEIDAVSVCVPNDMHAPIAIAALEAGKHVLLEKPMTLNASLGEEILKARDKAGKLLQMGMVKRQAADSIAVKELIDNGRLGEIYQIRVKLIRRRGIPGLGGWFTTKARSGGGGLIDIAVHFLDLAMWSTGLWNPTKVSAKVYSKFGRDMKNYHYINMWAGPPNYEGTFDVDDYAAGFVRFGKQATLSFEVAWACNAQVESYIEILGDKGGVKIGEKDTVLLTELDGKLADIKLDYDKTRDPFVGEMQKFADAVQGKGEVAATGEEGLTAMKLLDAIYRSSEEDREIVL